MHSHQRLAASPLAPAACRLFYWTRLAYRKEDDLDYEFINVDAAKRLFNLDQHAMVWDDETDTHVVLGWSDSQVVLAFRGTASLQVCAAACRRNKAGLARCQHTPPSGWSGHCRPADASMIHPATCTWFHVHFLCIFPLCVLACLAECND